MTKEEETKRNEAIFLMQGHEIEDGKYWALGAQFSRIPYNESCEWLMQSYLDVQSFGYRGNIEKLAYGDNRVWFNDENGAVSGSGNRHEDLITAIWLTVSDFAIEFNKKDEPNNKNELGYDLGGIGCGAGVDF